MLFKLKRFPQKCFTFKNYSKLSKFKSWVSSLYYQPKSKIDLSQLKIAPVAVSDVNSEKYIPLTKPTLLRLVSQDRDLIKTENISDFENFSRFLDSCIANRMFFTFNDIKTSYQVLNPDLVKVSGGSPVRVSRSKLLDQEYWFIQKLTKLMELANFTELDRENLEKLLNISGNFRTVKTWIESDDYKILKVWVMGKYEKPLQFFGLNVPKWLNFGVKYSHGKDKCFRRVAIALQVKSSDKIELKLFKDLSEQEIVHAFPSIHIGNTKFDNYTYMTVASMFCLGFATHFAVGALPLDWQTTMLFSTTSQLANTLVVLSVMVGVAEWGVLQKKFSYYWKYRANLTYLNIIGNNQGMISLLCDRGQDEILKESILSYIHIQRSPGITQNQLKLEIQRWVENNCTMPSDSRLSINLEDCISLLKQLGLIDVTDGVEGQGYTLTGKSFQSVIPMLKTENYAEASNSTIPAEGFESLLVKTEKQVGH